MMYTNFLIHILVASIAIVLDLVIGDPPNVVHPVAYMGKYIGFLRKQNPLSGRRGAFIYGILIILSGVALFSMPWIILNAFNIPFFWIAEIFLFKAVFSIRGLVRAGDHIRKALEKGDLSEARTQVGTHLVSRDTSGLTEKQVVSATVESIAENITDGFTSPLFYFALFGLPGAWAFRFCNTADSMIAYRTGELEYLGKWAAWTDTVLNWIPSRLSGLLMTAGAFFAGEDAGQAWYTVRHQRKKTASPNAGWTMAAMAGALHVTLEKVGHYTLEGGTEELEPDHIRRSVRVLMFTSILVYLVLASLMGVLYACFA